jgi:hypothetical protein
MTADAVAAGVKLAERVEDDHVGEGEACAAYRSAPVSQGGEAPMLSRTRAPRVPFRRRATDRAGCRAGSGKRRAATGAVGRRRERGPPISGEAGAKIGACSLACHHGGSRKVAFSLNARGRPASPTRRATERPAPPAAVAPPATSSDALILDLILTHRPGSAPSLESRGAHIRVG